MEENDLDIPTKEAKPLFNAEEYDGSRVKIAKVERVLIPSHYNNNVYDANFTEQLQGIRVETEPIAEIAYPDGTKKSVTVSERFPLQTDEKGNVFISKNPKAKLWKFMRKIGANNLAEIKGKVVRIDAVPSKDENDARKFLRINL